MKLRSPWRRWLPAIVALVIAVLAAGALVIAGGDSDEALVVYNGRSHYGGEKAFAAFTRETGIKVTLFGGDAQTLHDRLKSEGKDSPADLLVTVDGANLWRAKNEGLLQAVASSTIARHIPASLRDADGNWTALSTRVRTPMRSTERVPDGAVTSYEDLGDQRFRGRLCLRTSNSIYNQSFVADLIAKRGEAAAEALLRTWMSNEPRILGNDLAVLSDLAAGRCDVGLTNHYYLARKLKTEPAFKVAPAFPVDDSAGAHANLSGAGVVKWTNRRADAVKLMEFLVQRAAQVAIAEMGEFPANPDVAPIEVVRSWGEIKLDPIDAAGAGRHAADAVALMQKVGWD